MPVTDMLYPEGIEFLHTVRSVGVDAHGGLARHGGRVPDLFALVRVVALRISVERLIGPGVLRAAGAAFLDAFMAFQDQLEDATAKAAVLKLPPSRVGSRRGFPCKMALSRSFLSVSAASRS